MKNYFKYMRRKHSWIIFYLSEKIVILTYNVKPHKEPTNLENLAAATGLEKVSFHSNPKGNAKECSNYRTIALISHAAAAAKSLQSCLTLCDPMDCSLPGFSVHGILQARTLEWVAISFSNAWKWDVKVKLLSRVWLLATPWTAAHQAPPSMGFSRQEYWSGVPLPSPR